MLNVIYDFIIISEARDLIAALPREQLVGCHTAYQHVRMCPGPDFIILIPDTAAFELILVKDA